MRFTWTLLFLRVHELLSQVYPNNQCTPKKSFEIPRSNYRSGMGSKVNLATGAPEGGLRMGLN